MWPAILIKPPIPPWAEYVTEGKVRPVVHTPRKTGGCKITLLPSSPGTLERSELNAMSKRERMLKKRSVERESGFRCPNSTGDD